MSNYPRPFVFALSELVHVFPLGRPVSKYGARVALLNFYPAPQPGTPSTPEERATRADDVEYTLTAMIAGGYLNEVEGSPDEVVRPMPVQPVLVTLADGVTMPLADAPAYVAAQAARRDALDPKQIEMKDLRRRLNTLEAESA